MRETPEEALNSAAASISESVDPGNVVIPVTGSAVTVADATEHSGRTWNLLSIALFVGALVLLLAFFAGFGVLRRALHVSRKRKAESAFNAREEDFKAEVARKAANRIQMESEVKLMLAKRDSNGTSESGKPAQSTSVVKPAAAGSDSEIDLNIAHGRYSEAEKLLLEVIGKTPRNYSAKLRLAEVYYMTEKTGEFCLLAEDLHHEHRSDMSDEEWRRVIRMGKIIAPDRVPFSGPRAVTHTLDAS
jgi:hypothetical protein